MVSTQVLRDFLCYLSTMDEMAKNKAQLIKQKKIDAENLQREKENLPPRQQRERAAPLNKISVGHTDEITSSTYLGLLVTVKTALDLIDYLHDNLNYQYLMTRRLNQDALEVRLTVFNKLKKYIHIVIEQNITSIVLTALLWAIAVCLWIK